LLKNKPRAKNTRPMLCMDCNMKGDGERQRFRSRILASLARRTRHVFEKESDSLMLRLLFYHVEAGFARGDGDFAGEAAGFGMGERAVGGGGFGGGGIPLLSFALTFERERAGEGLVGFVEEHVDIGVGEFAVNGFERGGGFLAGCAGAVGSGIKLHIVRE